ncbi:MAG: AAA family ATPase, partial [Candidatus Binatia bacterium]
MQFGPFRFDVAEERLWKGGELIPLRRKAFFMLRHLLEHAGSLVGKDELMDAVWPETHVGEAVLKVAMQEIRRALGDQAGKPRFVETVYRRGYRFLAPVTVNGNSHADRVVSRHPHATPAPPRAETRPGALIEREAELGELDRLLEQALRGERRVAFVTGEPGIGKSALVEGFLTRAAARPDVWIAVGQCLEHHVSGEAYLPILEALGRMTREPEGARLVRLLRLHAPTWLAEMPELLAENERRELEREARAGSRERMLREITETLEALSRETPLVLVLEDLHWCDYSTLDMLASLARRRGPARLLVVGTYRPVDVIVAEHPLKAVKQELAFHRQCVEVAVGCLSESGVTEYLAQRFPDHDLPVELAGLIYQRTDGNPLFVLNVVDDLVARRMIAEREGRWRLSAELREIELGVPELRASRRVEPDPADRLAHADAAPTGLE